MNPDFLRRREVDGEILVAAEAADVYDASWFAEAGEGDRRDRVAGGRGSVRIFDTAIGPLVKRTYLRGGLPRHLVRDRYLWTGAETTRSFREFRILRALRDQGLRVPVAIAARYRRRGLSYQAALLMRLIPATSTLAEFMAENGDIGTVMSDVAIAIADLHRARVWHADLNAMNILIDAEGTVWLIDFDRAQDGVDDATRLANNLDRLQRSLRKILAPSRLAVVEAFWPEFVRRYHRRLGGVSSAPA